VKLCIIPARGGSKRIPRKNIKAFNGQPMIAYSINAAIESGCFDKIIVSTDDEEISKIAINYGAEIPFLRPKELATDNAGTLPVIKHAVEWYEEQGIMLDAACCLYATAPFVSPHLLQSAYKQFNEGTADYCFSATSFPFPIQRAIRIKKNNRVEMFQPENFNVRSQDLEEAYHDAGQFYWGSSGAFKLMKPLFSESSTAYILPRYLVQDIDTMEDWIRAELMHQLLMSSERL